MDTRIVIFCKAEIRRPEIKQLPENCTKQESFKQVVSRIIGHSAYRSQNENR